MTGGREHATSLLDNAALLNPPPVVSGKTYLTTKDVVLKKRSKILMDMVTSYGIYLNALGRNVQDIKVNLAALQTRRNT